MKTKKFYITAILSSLGMAALILDTKTALMGAKEGIGLCIQTVIPSLFPFFVVSILLTASVTGYKIPFLAPLCKLLRIPAGAESLLAVGFLGGYPVGAQCIAQAQRSGALSAASAKRMLAFCSNAGPAFLFGIGARLFPQIWMCWLLWGIHMISAFLVGILTPGQRNESVTLKGAKPITFPMALRRSLPVMAMVCGWVILFRLLMAFMQRWFLWLLPDTAQVTVYGLLELANGCISLGNVDQIGLRFTLFAIFLGFGGLCVTMQTYSVTEGIDTSLYLSGKLTQAAISLLLCIPAQFLFSRENRWMPSIILIVLSGAVCCAYILLTRKRKNSSSIPATVGV